jgi:hypothetical protein
MIMHALRGAARCYHVVISVGTHVENPAQNVTKNQSASIHVVILLRYLAIQLWKHIHAKRNVPFYSVVVTNAQGNVVTAIHHESIQCALLRSNYIVTAVTL